MLALMPGVDRSGFGRSGVDAAVTAKTGEGVTVDASDQELQQYLFDPQGYLVIHNVLGAAEVAELNRLIDAQRLPSPRDLRRRPKPLPAPPPAARKSTT